MDEIRQPRAAANAADTTARRVGQLNFWRRLSSPASGNLFHGVRAEATDLPYRPDVDGLRGIAVLAVVAFHANFYLPGGFTGVDVFFVISGFLITGIISRDLATGRFTLAHFYERRVRRILPALFVTLLGVTLLSLALSSPLRLHELGRSLLYSAFFGTNFLFAGGTSYFEQSDVGQPLLHTWSLSVEEQYYFAYPALVAFFFWRRWYLGAFLLLASGVSLAVSEWQVHVAPKSAFYGTHARAWELFVGGLLASRRLHLVRSRLLLEATAIVGALAIATAYFAFSWATPFPGVHALVPVLGAAAIIYAGGCGPTLVNSVLAVRPLVWIGLISYSLYLWHWPLLMLLRDFLGDAAPRRYAVACILLSMGIAWASLVLVETPVRRRKVFRTRRQIFLAAALGLGSVAAAGAWLSQSSGLLWRYSPEAEALLAYTDEPTDRWHYESCFITSQEQRFDARKCLRIDPQRRNVLLLGDSHAAHLRSGIEELHPDLNLLQATGCNPVVGAAYEAHCGELLNITFRQFLPKHRMDLILVSQSWFNDESDVPRIAETVAYLRRFSPNVVIIGPTPLFDRPEPELLASDIRFGIDLVRRHLVRDVQKLDARMGALARKEGWNYLSAYTALCEDQCLLYAAPGIPLYRDRGHFTVAGSRLFAEQVLSPVFAPWMP